MSFTDWIKGEGEGIFGRIIKSSATKERRRLERALGDGGLFPEVDHETRKRIADCDYAAAEGQKKIERHAKRAATIEELAHQQQAPGGDK